MSDDDTSQQQRSNGQDQSPPRTLHERIMDLYHSDDLPHVARGYWYKLLVEAAIVTVPITVLVIPVGVLLAWQGIGPVTYANTVLAWLTVSTTILGFSWCLLESGQNPQPRGAD